MNNLKLYQDEILENFKEIFYGRIKNTLQIQFEDIYAVVLEQFQLKKIDLEIKILLQDWFNNMYNQEFIFKHINQSFEEIIFFSNQYAEIIVNGEKQILKTDQVSAFEFQKTLEILVLKENKVWNTLNPFVSFEFKAKNKALRLSLVHKDTSPKSESKLFIRSIQENTLDINHFTKDEECIETLNQLIKNKANILLAGSTGSGKTTLLNSLLRKTSDHEHIVILEDTHEIELKRQNVTYLVSNEHITNHTLENFCAYSMRMSPDRIILGEMRSREVIPFLLSMNSGHKGLMTTIHSNSAHDSLARIVTLFGIYSGNIEIKSDFVLELICRNLDYVVFVENKKVTEIVKVLGADNNRAFTESIYLKAS